MQSSPNTNPPMLIAMAVFACCRPEGSIRPASISLMSPFAITQEAMLARGQQNRSTTASPMERPISVPPRCGRRSDGGGIALAAPAAPCMLQPHLPQNAVPGCWGVPHWGQKIVPPVAPILIALYPQTGVAGFYTVSVVSYVLEVS